MPLIHRRGRLFVGRETGTYGTGSTAALPGVGYGPLSGMACATLGAQAGVAGLVMPTLTRDFELQFAKHQSPAQVGRRFEDVSLVPGRRQTAGQFSVEVMPDSFGLLLYLGLGTDVVTATGSTTTTGTNAANQTTLNVATGLPLLGDGQYIFISDGVNSEYVQVNGARAANTTAIPIKGGAGTGGGLKFTHATSLAVQVGPWTHAMTPSAGSPGTWQGEDNFGGATTSLLYKGMLIDSLELQAPIENETAALTALVKVLGMAPSSTPVAASAAAGPMPLEEVSIAAGNSVAVAITGGTDATIYVPDFKATISNTARLAKASSSSPDPYAGLGTNFNLRGTMETVFEDYGVFQDFATNAIWAPLTVTFTWPQALMYKGAAGPATGTQAASLAMSVQRFAIEKLGKEAQKDDMVRLPIDAWRAEDYPDYTTLATFTLVNNVAAY